MGLELKFVDSKFCVLPGLLCIHMKKIQVMPVRA
jgi:hypothetical protein